MCAHCMQLHKWELCHTARQYDCWVTLGDALEKTVGQHSWVLIEAAAIEMTNYCPFRVRYYNDGKGSITNELLEMAVQNSWAAEKDFIGTDRVREEQILLPEGIERGSFLCCKEFVTCPGGALQKNVLCFRPHFQIFYWNHFHSFQWNNAFPVKLGFISSLSLMRSLALVQLGGKG